MHTVLALEVAIGKIALDADGHALDASLVAVKVVHDLHLVAVAVGPHVVHAVEHRSPVLSLSSACARVDFQDCLHRVFFLAKHILQFKIFDCLDSFLVILFDLFFGHHLVLIKVKSKLQFVGESTHFLISIYPLLNAFHFLHLLLCPYPVFPEVRCLCTKVFFFVLYLLLVDIEVTV